MTVRTSGSFQSILHFRCQAVCVSSDSVMKWSLWFLFAIWCLCCSHAVGKIKANQPIEIVILVDISCRLAQCKTLPSPWSLMSLVRNFPDHADLSETGLRMAVIQFSTTSNIWLNLTAEEKWLRNYLTPFRGDDVTNTEKAFEDAAVVLRQSRPNAVKIVLLLVEYFTREMAMVEAAADKLRRSGVTIFVGMLGSIFRDRDAKEHYVKIAGGAKRFRGFDELFINSYFVSKELLEMMFCETEEICSFNQDRNCVWNWQPAVESNVQCNGSSKSFQRSCPRDQCEKTCSRWAWEKKECNDVNTGTVTIQRHGPKPQQALYAFCPVTKTTVCPPKRTTTVKQTTTTTKRTTTTTKRTTMMTMRTTTAKPIRPPPPKKTLKPNEGPDATVSMMGVSNERPGVTTAGSGGQDGVRQESKSRFWGWAIALIVLIVLLLLLLLLVALVVSRRRRRAAKQRHHGKPRYGLPSRSPNHGLRNGQNVVPSGGARGSMARASAGKQPAHSGSRDSRPPHYPSRGPRSSSQPSGSSVDAAHDRSRNVKKADKSTGISLPSMQQKKQAPAKSFQTSWGPKGKSDSAGVSLPTVRQKKLSRGQSPTRGPVPGPSFQKPYDRGPKEKKAVKSARVSLASMQQKKQNRCQCPSRGPAPAKSFQHGRKPSPKKSTAVSLESRGGKKKGGK